MSSCVYQSTETTGATTAQYTIDSLTARPDTLSVGDTLKVTLGVILDCTNLITRIDTPLDTATTPRTLTISIFGTIWNGIGPRPLCPALFKMKEVHVALPRSGVWIVEAGEPPGTIRSLRDTVFVNKQIKPGKPYHGPSSLNSPQVGPKPVSCELLIVSKQFDTLVYHRGLFVIADHPDSGKHFTNRRAQIAQLHTHK